MISHIINFPILNRYRIIIIIAMHIIFSALSLLLSFLIRFDFTFGPYNHTLHLIYSLPINIAVFIIFSGIFRLFQGIWRYVSVDDLKDIVKTSFISSLIFIIIVSVVFKDAFSGYPRSVFLINFVFFILINGGTRFTIRIFRESFAPMSDNVRNVLIVGAGTAGNELAKTLKSSKNRQYIPVGYIDKNESTHGKRLQGIKVLGGVNSIGVYIKRYRVHEIFIAIPEATNKTIKEIMRASKVPDWDIKFKIVPSMLDIMSGRLKITQISDVSINDLLSRPNITLDDAPIRKQIAGKTVLITGAGGSIGSEICYQVTAFNPARVILIDSSEENTYKIDLSLKKRHKNISIHTIVGSILDTAILDMVMREFSIDFLFHAAAYKHVHLMEWNPIAAFKNNVLGTAVLANAAERYGIKQFVMISTDKAVNPRGIMGVSKRLTERIILERHPSATKFNVVRFGNVLGSSGSVIPLFQQQIRDGGPITVTSPDTTRYFMSIPEAVQLVLQASTLNEANAIFMLEMGDPIKIVDLAKNLIELSGLKVGEDIEIIYTGLRPGEKIYEELLTAHENLIKTPFKKIRMQKNGNYSPDRIEKFVHDLKSNAELGNIKAIYNDVVELIPEMTGPSFEELRKNMFG